MRFIEINKLEQAALDIGWESIKNGHLAVLSSKSPTERKEYINSNPDWNKFQAAMLGLSHNKCWYTEAPIGSSDFEVDHFRPKNKSKQKIDYTNPASKSVVHKENGYWWKAYDWDNYRLSGALANKIRRDRLGDCEDPKGKGDYFPLDLATGKVASDQENVSCEDVVLLDPTNLVDVSLVTFDKGVPIPATTEEYDINRVKQSIFYYHLDLDQLNTARKIVWDDCLRHIEDAKSSIDSARTPHERTTMMKKCFEELKDLVNSERKSYTSTAKACLMYHSELSDYPWLKNLIRSL